MTRTRIAAAIALALLCSSPAAAQSIEAYGQASLLDVGERTYNGISGGANVTTSVGLAFGGDVSQYFAKTKRSIVVGGGTELRSFGLYTGQLTYRLPTSVSATLQPFALLGAGFATDPDSSDHYRAITLGAGANLWFAKRVGATGAFRKLFLPSSDAGGHIWSVGLVVR